MWMINFGQKPSSGICILLPPWSSLVENVFVERTWCLRSLSIPEYVWTLAVDGARDPVTRDYLTHWENIGLEGPGVDIVGHAIDALFVGEVVGVAGICTRHMRGMFVSDGDGRNGCIVTPRQLVRGVSKISFDRCVKGLVEKGSASMPISGRRSHASIPSSKLVSTWCCKRVKS